MDSLLDDIVDRSTLGYKYIGTYERWATPTLGAVFDGILCFNENGHMSLTMSDNSQSYEFYSPLQLGYDIKDHLEDFTPPEYTTSIFFVSTHSHLSSDKILFRCNVINWD